jgi:cell division protein FtsI (penicillin-binding protein 3)
MSRLRRRFQRHSKNPILAALGVGTPGPGAHRRRDALVPTERARRARFALLATGVAAGFLGLAARCVDLQVLRAGSLVDLANAQHERTEPLDPRRGPILDRNGRELAMSLEVDSLYADPSMIVDAGAAARRLAPLLGIKAADLKTKLDSDKRFVWLKRKMDPDLRKRIESLAIEGLFFERESRRYYPKGDLAAHVVGACGLDNQGLAGLEAAYNDRIKGTPGRLEFLRDGRGRIVLDRSRVEPIPGDGIRLTLDETIQHLAEREIDQAMNDFHATGATIVVLRPRTGEVLAIASRPGFDPNDYGKADDAGRRDRAVSDFYEPGSTFKVITAAAALDAGKVRPDEVIFCENGSYVVAKHRFHEDRVPYGSLTFTEVLAKSSNIGTIKVALRMPSSDFLDVIRRFGFGSTTALELPGESPGLLERLSHWKGLTHASVAMGQEIGVTPIQLAAALGAVANDGVYNPPHLVEAFLSPDNTETPPERRPEDVPRRVVSAQSARTLRHMLQSVTIDGTGKSAQVPGYTAGGKTGTAQKIDPATRRYSKSRYVAWFAGFVPADTPALAIVVMVDEPKGPKFHGGDVAAPVFSRVAEPALRYLGVKPDLDRPLVIDDSLRAAAPGQDEVAPAALKGARPVTVRVASNLGGSDLTPAGLSRFDALSRPAVLARNTAPAGARGTAGARGIAAPRGTPGARGAAATVPAQASILGLPVGGTRPAPGAAPGAATGIVAMPDLSGMSLRQATEALASLGLSCSSQSSGPRVVHQTPEAGAPVVPGSRCALVCE